LDPIEILLQALFSDALGFAITFLVPGTVAGLGTGIVVRIANPRASIPEITLIALSWVIAIMSGAYLSSALMAVIDYASAVGPCSFCPSPTTPFLWLPIVLGGTLAAAIGSACTFQRLARIARRAAANAA
jgi:flagellar biosynthesis protein FliQ